MPTIRLPADGWRPRPYQLPLWEYMERGGREAVAVWHRRAGKDELGLHIAAIKAHERVANYWHMLPQGEQARKAIWEAVNPRSGRRRIDEAFPLEIRETTRDQEMTIKFRVGSTWQVVGSDNYDRLVGASPAGIVYSEWALAKPQARAMLRPIIAENNGWELFIYTPRGRNHGLRTLEAARANPSSFSQVLGASATGSISQQVLDSERLAYIREYGDEQGEAFYRQEYECDFSAALLGAILGRQVDKAEREGRISDTVEYDMAGAPVEISSDIGRRDTCTWWFWQPQLGGYNIIDYMDGSGLDAEEWIEKLETRIIDAGYRIGKIWLPHDARAKTFAAKFSAVEQFVRHFGEQRVSIVPESTKADRINAARVVIQRCQFHAARCDEGLDGLRNWCYEWNDDRKEFSSEPRHDWASHPGDGYSYGAQVMRERQLPIEKPTAKSEVAKAAAHVPTFEEMLRRDDARHGARARI